MKRLLAAVLGLAVMAVSGIASAHVWNIGWKANGDGSLTMLGVSYHSGGIGGAGSVDDFSVNPAGFVINGTNLGFQNGTVVDLNDCNVGSSGGFGSTSVTGTCAPVLNAFGLDDGIQATNSGSFTFGKYALATIAAGDLGTYGIVAGQSNNVSLTTFANNVHWQGLNFGVGNIPINVVIVIPPTPDPSVPEPGTLALMALGLAGVGLRKKLIR